MKWTIETDGGGADGWTGRAYTDDGILLAEEQVYSRGEARKLARRVAARRAPIVALQMSHPVSEADALTIVNAWLGRGKITYYTRRHDGGWISVHCPECGQSWIPWAASDGIRMCEDDSGNGECLS